MKSKEEILAERLMNGVHIISDGAVLYPSFWCPSCKRREVIVIPLAATWEMYAGTRVRCRKCGATFTVLSVEKWGQSG